VNPEQDTYGDIGICKCAELGYGDVNYRSLWRFDLSALAGKTITTAQLRLYILQMPSLIYNYWLLWVMTDLGPPIVKYYAWQCDTPYYRSGWPATCNVYRLLDTNWTESSTMHGEGWTDASKIDTTSFGSFASGTGLKYIALNASAITYLQAACSGAGDPGGAGTEVNLTLQGFNNGDYTQTCTIASSEHGTANYKPALIISYT